jgi:DNA polymerase-3 subunit beta
MKFSVHRDDIHQAIASAQRATATRVIQPILSNIMIETLPGENRLRLSATDLDFAVVTTVDATIEVEGRTTLAAKKVSEILAKLPSGSMVTFEIEEAAQTARIHCGSSRFDMRTLSADEFPLIKQIDQETYFDVDLKSFVRAINQTSFAAASHESNNVLGGVYFQLTSTHLEMAATDGSRLARRLEPLSEPSVQETVSAIIPARALLEVLKLNGANPSGDEKVRLSILDGQISFRTSRFYVLSRLLDGQYPKYAQLIPADNKLVAYANKEAFISSLERAAVMANERTNIVKMAFDKGNLSLAANTPDVGDAKDTMEILYEGDPMNIAFNYKYVLDALKVIESDDVRVEMNGALSPTLFKAKEENDYLCLVMPVQVK